MLKENRDYAADLNDFVFRLTVYSLTP